MRICLALAVLTALGIATALSVPLSAAQGMPHVILGYVTDLEGNPVSGAQVVLKNERTGETASVTANSLGQYQTDLSSLPGGYQTGDTITVTAASGSMEGSSSITVSTNALDQCDIILDTDVSEEETPFPGIISIAFLASVLCVSAGLYRRSRK